MATLVDTWFSSHRARLQRAVEACAQRSAWTPFIESPSGTLHPDGAKAAGQAWFDATLGTSFPLTMPGEIGRTGAEVSPYTGEPLGVDYPAVDPDALMRAAKAALPSWRDAGVQARVGVCMEILDRLAADVFANAFATMHTAGQGFMMAFAGSGANSLDRGLEGLAYAYKAMRDVPEGAVFERRFGGAPVRLRKRYRLIPRGVAVVISCGSYPAWNAYPALFANLATANPVVLKPHPECILPMARAVQIARATLEEAGFDPNVVTLAADTRASPITKDLLLHESTAIIDFTGSQAFGAWIETHCTAADVYTETAGCNAVVVESAVALDPVVDAIAQSLCLFSAQMCTAAQNIFVPRDGVRVGEERVSPAAFSEALVGAIDRMLADPQHAAGICGALQTDAINDTLRRLADHPGVVRASVPYAHPAYPNARTATPLVIRASAPDSVYQQEHFGPVGFVIEADSREQALEHASADAQQFGSIANYAYSVDPRFCAAIEDTFASRGSSVGINLLGQRPINFTAAFSDYHVTGLNPAGNACLTDLAFVTRRFRIVQSKTEEPCPASTTS
ncbi:MAG: phenylacetic acid degradation protein PaaN [Nannocystaceae bacterium]|nr:phenylacetic acid degradation protein PaaN [bacterium]